SLCSSSYAAHPARDPFPTRRSSDLDVDGYAELSSASPVPIAAGEWLSTRHDFAVLIDRGGVQVVQPDIGRVGGFTEARRVCALAAERGRMIVPHAWKTGLSVAAAAQ